jgi:D-serine deaminase-like pyridoxal phosphate-dependent protein
MNPEIASLHERMAQGGDWKAYQQEIARLNKEARTQEEYVAVLEAHRNLIAVAEHCFAPETAAEIQRIGGAEYKLFLNVEAMEGDMINPIMLDKITAREVAAGRLAPDDEFRKLAEAGGSVMGDSAGMEYDRKLGDGIGMAGAVLGVLVFFMVNKTLGVILFVAGMGAGWFINESRKKRAMHGAQVDRAVRGYE